MNEEKHQERELEELIYHKTEEIRRYVRHSLVYTSISVFCIFLYIGAVEYFFSGKLAAYGWYGLFGLLFLCVDIVLSCWAGELLDMQDNLKELKLSKGNLDE